MNKVDDVKRKCTLCEIGKSNKTAPSWLQQFICKFIWQRRGTKRGHYHSVANTAINNVLYITQI